MKKLFIILIGAFSFTACEKVIDLKLQDAETKLVVEGNIELGAPARIQLTETASYFEDNVFPGVSNAEVVITDDQGNTESLVEVEPGIYETKNLIGVADRTYTLDIENNGESYAATSIMPELKSPIDTLTSDSIDAIFGAGIQVIVNMTDPVGDQFYLVKFYRNGERVVANGGDVLFRDFELGDPGPMFFGLRDFVDVGDTIDVELISMDEEGYTYFLTLAEISGQGGFGSVPKNPITNVSNDAVGYFGAYAVDRKTIIVPE